MIETGANLGFARANNIGIRASTRHQHPAAQQRHGRAAGAIDRLLAELDARSGGRRRRTAARGRQRPRGAVVRPDDRSAERVAAEAAARGAAPSRRSRGGGSIPTGSAAPACWCGAPTPRRSAASTSGISCTPRTSTSAPRSARAAAGSCSRPTSRSSTCAADRRPARRPRRATHYRRSQLAFYEKHHPALGAAAQALCQDLAVDGAFPTSEPARRADRRPRGRRSSRSPLGARGRRSAASYSAADQTPRWRLAQAVVRQRPRARRDPPSSTSSRRPPRPRADARGTAPPASEPRPRLPRPSAGTDGARARHGRRREVEARQAAAAARRRRSPPQPASRT